jgi:hypothetical protein
LSYLEEGHWETVAGSLALLMQEVGKSSDQFMIL